MSDYEDKTIHVLNRNGISVENDIDKLIQGKNDLLSEQAGEIEKQKKIIKKLAEKLYKKDIKNKYICPTQEIYNSCKNPLSKERCTNCYIEWAEKEVSGDT